MTERNVSGSHSSLDKELDVEHHEVVHSGRKPLALMTPAEKQKEMQKALAVDPGVTRFSWAAIQVRCLHCYALRWRVNVLAMNLSWYLLPFLTDVFGDLGGMLLLRG
jgi:hypothetical protein